MSLPGNHIFNALVCISDKAIVKHVSESWLVWVSRNRGPVFTTSAVFLTCIATVVLASAQLKTVRQNRAQIRLSRIQFNRQFLGQEYESIILLMTKVSDVFKTWLGEIKQRKDFKALDVVPLDELLAQNELGLSVEIKRHLYPNAVIDPLFLQWRDSFERLGTVFKGLLEMDANQLDDDGTLPEAIILATIPRMEAGIAELEKQRDVILAAMSEELKI
jgi:hypothetical protein